MYAIFVLLKNRYFIYKLLNAKIAITWKQVDIINIYVIFTKYSHN